MEKKSRKKSVTSVDVAKAVGVSPATVSRVFREDTKNLVRPEVRERIIKVSKEMGYSPNLVARGMISGKTNIIALVTGENPGPFYQYIISQFIKEIQETGKQCLVFYVSRQSNMENIIEKVLQFHVEALIITASAMNEDLKDSCDNAGIPVVLFNKVLPNVDINTICVDSFTSGQLAAAYLLERGHRKIAYIRYKNSSQEEDEKYIGFYSELRKYGVSISREIASDYVYEACYEKSKQLFSNNNDITAVFCTSDILAISVIDMLRNEYSLSVPDDVSVIGCDNIEVSSYKSYELHTMRQPIEEMIKETMELIEKILDGTQTESMLKIFKPKVEERNSVRDINV